MNNRKPAQSTDDIFNHFVSIAPYWVGGALWVESASPGYWRAADRHSVKESVKACGKRVVGTSRWVT